MTEPLPAGWSPSVEALGASWSALAEEVKATALAASVRTLWALSGRQFGTRTITLAPYLSPPRRGWYDSHHRGIGGSGVGLNAAAGIAVNGVGVCGTARTFRLPGPVVRVDQVVVDGQVLDRAAWTLDPDGTLVRSDGGGWPVGQDVYLPRWLVTYVRGIVAPADANLAAARYAMELARAITANPRCKLPARTRDVARQGISVSLADPTELSEAGLTGITSVDRWLRAVNPAGLAVGASIWTPTQARHRVVAVHDDA